MINMDCGTADSKIVAGDSDSMLRWLAIGFRNYGQPVLFRWFWEMNLTKVGRHPRCLGSSGGSGYVAAYRHIWTIFHSEGADNVAFVWGLSDAQSAKNRFDTTYYPGNSYVDWIAADLYDRPNQTKPWGEQFGPFYRWWSTYAPSKPIMLSETGAVGAPAQALWLSQVAAALSTAVPGIAGTPFTHVHAVVYVDAVDIYNYIIGDKGAGFDEFSKIGQEPYFSQMG